MRTLYASTVAPTATAAIRQQQRQQRRRPRRRVSTHVNRNSVRLMACRSPLPCAHLGERLLSLLLLLLRSKVCRFSLQDVVYSTPRHSFDAQNRRMHLAAAALTFLLLLLTRIFVHSQENWVLLLLPSAGPPMPVKECRKNSDRQTTPPHVGFVLPVTIGLNFLGGNRPIGFLRPKIPWHCGKLIAHSMAFTIH